MSQIIILGAGVIGVTTAYELRRKGHDVKVLDMAAGAGLATSFANGSQLSYSKTHPLSDMETLKRLPSLIFSKNTPIHIHPGFDLGFLRWGVQFMRECAPERSRANAGQVLELALDSRRNLHEIAARHNLNFDYEKRGKMYLFTDKAEFDKTAVQIDHFNQHGFDQVALTPAEAVVIEPGLIVMQTVLKGVIYSKIDEAGDAHKFTVELARVCAEMGVEFEYGVKIDNFQVEHGQILAANAGEREFKADKFVVCTGPETPRLLKKLGIYVPIYPMKGYSLTVPATEFTPQVNLTDESRRVVYAKIGNRLRIAGVAEFAGYNYKINRKIVDGMIKTARQWFPRAGDYSKVEEWTGLRPMTPSTVPITGKHAKFGNLYLNTGHGMLGWTLACGSAAKLAGKINE